jgi:hypothetical protein
MMNPTQRPFLVMSISVLVGSACHLSQAFTVASRGATSRGIPSTIQASSIETEIPYYAQISTYERIIEDSTDKVEIVQNIPMPKVKKVVKKGGSGAKHKEGVFSPVVYLAKDILGQDKLNKLRGKVISIHSDVIGKFVDTHETSFGQTMLSTLYRAADTNGDGKLSADEIESALRSLGFVWLKEKQIDGIIKRADLDKNGEIDWEEYVKAAPKTIRTNLVKLAKKNGTEMGLLV